MDNPSLDLSTLDRDVRRAAFRIDQRNAWLAEGTKEARDRARSFDAWSGLRHTSVQATYRELQEQTPSLLDVPLRDGLLRWIHELVQARVGEALQIDEADAEMAIDARISPRHAAELAAREAAVRDASRSALEGPESPPHDAAGEAAPTYREAFAGIAAAPNEGRAAAALTRAGELAAPVAAARKERRARRFEAARRLGLVHPFALATKANVGALARSFLDATEPLSVELLKTARKTSEGPWRASSAIQLALGRAANDGWPAHLGGRWLDDAFNALAPRGVDVGTFAEPLGGASFLRAAAAWGFAWRTAGSPRSLPFALARDPYPVPAFRFGFAIASVVAEPAFQRRALALSSRLATAQSRVLRTTLFLRARTLAARAVLASEERVTAPFFEEIGARVFGAPLPATMREAWPDLRVDEPARLLALLGTQTFMRNLVERYDEDWFRNPRAGTHLTSLACGPAFDDDLVADGAPAALARAFEEFLG